MSTISPEGIAGALLGLTTAVLVAWTRKMAWAAKTASGEKRTEAAVTAQITAQLLERDAEVWRDLRNDLGQFRHRLIQLEQERERAQQMIRSLQLRVRTLENQILDLGAKPVDHHSDDDADLLT